MSHYTYLIIDLACISIPLIASFYPPKAFYKEWKHFIPANLIVATLFLLWDYFFTKEGIWGFNEKYLSGIYLSNLPLEEILFFVAIPYSCVFTWFALKYLLKKNPLSKVEKYISLVLGLVLLILGIIFIGKAYTSLTFLLTAAYLFYSYFKGNNMSYVYLSYLLILPFFFISNGVLTGSGLEEPIVWYNDEENLGLRIFTIPVEDSIYGFLLISLNIHLYKILKRSY